MSMLLQPAPRPCVRAPGDLACGPAFVSQPTNHVYRYPRTLPVNEANHIRNIVVIASLVTLIALMCTQIGIAAMDVLAARPRKPKYCCRSFTVAIVPIYIFAMWLVWVLTGGLFAVTTIVSDLCVDPALNVVNFAGSSRELGFFLTCGELSPEQQVAQNPFAP